MSLFRTCACALLYLQHLRSAKCMGGTPLPAAVVSEASAAMGCPSSFEIRGHCLFSSPCSKCVCIKNRGTPSIFCWRPAEPMRKTGTLQKTQKMLDPVLFLFFSGFGVPLNQCEKRAASKSTTTQCKQHETHQTYPFFKACFLQEADARTRLDPLRAVRGPGTPSRRTSRSSQSSRRLRNRRQRGSRKLRLRRRRPSRRPCSWGLLQKRLC